MASEGGTQALADGVEIKFFQAPVTVIKTTTGCPPLNQRTIAKGATTLHVENTGAAIALIRIPGLHSEGSGFPLLAGKEHDFTLAVMGIVKAFAQGSGGATSITFGVVSKTVPSN